MSVVGTAGRILGAGALAGAGLLGYSLIEARRPVLRRVEVPILAAGEAPVTVLHLSDLHLTDQHCAVGLPHLLA